MNLQLCYSRSLKYPSKTYSELCVWVTAQMSGFQKLHEWGSEYVSERANGTSWLPWLRMTSHLGCSGYDRS
jgi:hypothetical protein